jgi:DNA repair exonuclease SbcCD nuclease subunit
MKYILTADLHIHPHFNNNIFIDVGVNYLEYLKKYCISNNIKTIFFAGDIFHISSKINIETFIPVFEKFDELKKAGINSTLIPGNHEILAENKKTILSSFAPFSSIIDSYSSLTEYGVKFHFIPFKRTFLENEFKISLPTDKLNILITHLDIADFKMSEFAMSKGIKDRKFFKQFNWTFSGHYHTHQRQENIVYIGSPYQQNFGEVGEEKGFLIYDGETNSYERVIYNESPTFKIIDVEDSIDEDLSNSFVKLKIHKKIDNLSKLREILYDKGALNITQEFEIKEEANQLKEIKISENNSLLDMLHEFINQDKNNKDLDKEKLLSYVDKIFQKKGK